ncbi:MAG: M23 family metallopeptidase [Rhodanobacteraceae bacterium]
MNIILVPRRQKAPISLDLSKPRAALTLAGIATLVVGTCAALGAALALFLASPTDAAMAQLGKLRAQLHTQSSQLAAVQSDAQRQVNALALKLGELEAQSLRINALGERLTKLGKLDDGEFNFDQDPAVGGPEESDGGAYMLPGSLDAGIRDLGKRFDSQQQQLQVLQDLLIDHKVASNQRPTGMPVNTGYISSYYGKRIDPFDGHTAFHRGLDFAANRGTPVHTVAEGVVTFAGVRSGYGNVVEIDHGNGYATRYAHNSKILVHVGQRVRVGQEIAVVGSTGRSTGPHSHFEVWYHGRSVNPLAYVHSHRG